MRHVRPCGDVQAGDPGYRQWSSVKRGSRFSPSPPGLFRKERSGTASEKVGTPDAFRRDRPGDRFRSTFPIGSAEKREAHPSFKGFSNRRNSPMLRDLGGQHAQVHHYRVRRSGGVQTDSASCTRRRSRTRRKLKQQGALIAIAGEPVQIRNPDAQGVGKTPGAFMTSSLPIAGFAVIEAADLAEAIELVAQSPCAVAHGVVEVWPLREAI